MTNVFTERNKTAEKRTRNDIPHFHLVGKKHQYDVVKTTSKKLENNCKPFCFTASLGKKKKKTFQTLWSQQGHPPVLRRTCGKRFNVWQEPVALWIARDFCSTRIQNTTTSSAKLDPPPSLPTMGRWEAIAIKAAISPGARPWDPWPPAAPLENPRLISLTPLCLK